MTKTTLVLFLLAGTSILGQGNATGSATTQGSCSPANTGSSNTFTINCGIGKQQGDILLKIMNRILTSQLDPDAVMGKLDEIQQGVTQLRKSVNPNASRVTYLLEGGTRTSGPGGVSVMAGSTPEYEALMTLYRNSQWKVLIEKCEELMRTTPGWLTPFAFAGEAYARIGNTAKAIALLEQADEGMAGNRDYRNLPAAVRGLLLELKRH